MTPERILLVFMLLVIGALVYECKSLTTQRDKERKENLFLSVRLADEVTAVRVGKRKYEWLDDRYSKIEADFAEELADKEDLYSKIEELKQRLQEAEKRGAEELSGKQGTWIGGEFGRCSECGYSGCASDIWSGCSFDKFYCPNCGARLKDERW